MCEHCGERLPVAFRTRKGAEETFAWPLCAACIPEVDEDEWLDAVEVTLTHVVHQHATNPDYEVMQYE